MNDLIIGPNAAEEKLCDICKGDGVRLVVSNDRIPCRQPGRSLESLMAIPCFCRLNQRVEDRYPALRQGTFVTDKEIGVTLKLWDMNKNYLLTGNPDRFHKIIKALFVHMSQSSSIRFLMGNGLEIVKESYLSKEGGSDRDLLEVMRKWHFVVLKLETRIVNKAMQPVLVDMINARVANHLPTWVWGNGDITVYQEWSNEMNSALSAGRFVKKSLVLSQSSANLSNMINQQQSF